MRPLSHPDSFYLEAAQGWLDLGNHLQANEELDHISPRLRAHPDVLSVRYHVYAKAENWEMAVEIARSISNLVPEKSFGFIHLGEALHELGRTTEARDNLLSIVQKFPEQHIIPYNLACYSSQLGDLKAAWMWLEKAINLGDENKVKLMAFDDPDLELLWAEIGEI